jgi:hypothetical protein
MIVKTYNDYIDAIEKVAIYPEAGTGSAGAINYCFLGLVGEIGEFVSGLVPGVKACVKEYGDVWWYVTRLSVELDCIPGTIARICNTLYLTVDDSEEGLGSMSKFVLEHLGAMANKLKKVYRDNEGGEIDQETKKVLRENLFALVRVILYYKPLVTEGDLLGVFQANVDKLYRRKEAGTLKGSGDDR